MGILGRAFIVAAVAVLATALFKPVLFFHIPEFGFIPYVMAGGFLPPYMDHTMFDDDSWLKKGDVVVSVGAKCGTNWMMTMVHELRTWNIPEEKDFEDIFDVVPWAEFSQYPGITKEERVNLWNKRERWNSSKFPFRVFKSHMTPIPALKSDRKSRLQCLDIEGRSDVKFIAMTRDGRDVAKSLQKFFLAHSQEFRNLWGGFPPPLNSLDEAFDFVIPNENIAVLEYVKEWWPFRHHPNVLLLHYADVLDDVPGTLRKLAKFIGLQGITEEAYREIEQRVSIEFMKKRSERYRCLCGRNLDLAILPAKNGVIRQGGVGSSSQLSEKHLQMFNEHMDRMFDGDEELKAWYKQRMK
mmetsp:Transcript_17105/g.22378  ORF Transcript_17105/g.22378 Transcript_17105/m.22378 type:complete len:354 (+) Transcript_17105:186-1247(+)